MLVVDGMQAGVGAEGIVRLNMRASDRNSLAATTRKLPMRDRLVVLCKLGHGASSAVYKALDLTDMRLVALKMIHVNDRYVSTLVSCTYSIMVQLMSFNPFIMLP